MRRHAWKVALLAVLLGLAPIASAGAAGHHPTYPLGSATRCKAHYVERILKHKVKGKTVSYIACVYVTPKTTSATKSPYPNGEAGNEDFAVQSLQVSGQLDNDIGGTIRITNVGSQTYDVSFTVTFFATASETGTPLGSAEGAALNVAPGQTVTETLESLNPMFSQSKFWYQFQVNYEIPA